MTFDNKTGTGYVYTLEQNASAQTGLFAQKINRTYDKNGNPVYSVDSHISGYNVQGWARYQNQSNQNTSNQNYTNGNYTPATKPAKKP